MAGDKHSKVPPIQRNREKALTHLDSTSKDQIASNSRSHGRERRADLDNLRTFLTALVIVHHTAIAYGGVGGWKFKSRCFPPFSIGLAAFNGVDQTFFMGIFFYLSGRFAQLGLSRIQTNEIWLAFIRSRLLRLLLPAVVYTLTTEPTMTVMNDFFGPDAQATKIGVVGIAVHITSVFWAHLIQLRGINGPVWYCVLLTIFDIITSLAIPAYVWRTVHNSIKSRKRRMLPILWTSVILMSFLIRLVYPAGTSIALLNIQPAWLPQYIIAYTWGHLSLLSHDPYLLTPNPSQRRPVILLTCVLCFCVVCLGGVIVISIVLAPSDSIEDVVRSMAGGFNVPALLYAVWNELSFVTIAPSLISVFAQHLNTPFCIKSRDGRTREFARYSYASFLLHPPVSMVVELVVERMMACSLGPLSSAWIIWLGPGLMTISVGIVNILASWAAGWVMVEYVPFLWRIV
jgi:glucans biosynthesis protein C